MSRLDASARSGTPRGARAGRTRAGAVPGRRVGATAVALWLLAGAGLGLTGAAAQTSGAAPPAPRELPAEPPAFTPSEETPEQFPPGEGRDDTFASCTGCHNFKLVAAQGMSRRQWEDSLDWMVRRHGMPELSGAERERVLSYLEGAFPPRAPAAQRGWQNPFLR
ncbi:MAG: hypothetical protein HZA68_05215 [Rhodovulum sp.]|nr:hypothetical protein [Rhodovulum sp.]